LTNVFFFGKLYWNCENPFPKKMETMQCLKEIRFGNNFNHSVNSLPQSITYIYFGKRFNQIVDNFLLSLKEIIFGENFNHFFQDDL